MEAQNKGTGQTPQTPPNPMIKQSKWLDPMHLIGYALIVFAVGLIGFNVNRYLKDQSKSAPEQVPANQNSNSATSDLKTYTNSQYGFEFNYPSSATIYSAPVSGGFNVDVNYKGMTGYEPPRLNLTNKKGSQQYAEKTTFGNTGTESIHLVVGAKDLYTTCINDSKDQAVAGFCNQIVSTFKYTNSTSTAEWKTYTSTNYGFQFKYPNSWQIFGTNNERLSEGELFLGSSTEADKHKADISTTPLNYLATEPVIQMRFGYYSDNSVTSALKFYLGSNYNTASITNLVSDGGQSGLKYVGKDSVSNVISQIIVYTLPNPKQTVPGQGKPVIFFKYSYTGSPDSSVSANLDKIGKSFMLTNN